MERESPGRWLPMVGSMALQICGGSIYITGLYTSDLKDRFFPGAGGQYKVEQLVFACNLGNWLPASGFFFDSRCGGGRNTALAAALLTFLGYLGVAAWSAGVFPAQYWQVWIFWFLWGHGSGWFDNAAVSTTARNFPQQRGRSMALVKAFYGLSGSILTQIYDLFFDNRTSEFLFFLGIGLACFGALCAPTLWPVPLARHRERDEPVARLGRGLTLVVSLACLLLAVDVLRVAFGERLALNVVSFAMVLGCLGLLAWQLTCARRATEPVGTALGVSTAAICPPAESLVAVPADVLPKQAVTSARFWLLFVVVFVGMGGGLVVLNNVGQMVASLGGSHSTTSVLVSLISVFNCFGRVSMGVLTDKLSGRMRRPWFLVVNVTIMIMAHLLLAVGELPLLFVGAIVAAFCYGGFWTLSPSLVIEFFGLGSFATLYNCMSLAVSSASLVFSTLLAAKLYDMEASSHPLKPGSSHCVGPACYRLTCLITAACLAVGFFAALALSWISRRNEGNCPPPAQERESCSVF